MSSLREEVLVSLGIDHSTVANGLRQAESAIEGGVKRMVDSVKEFGKGMLAGFAVSELVSKFSEVSERVEHMSEMAKGLSVSTDFIQDIEHVAKASGVAGEKIEEMLGHFARTLPAGSDVEQSFYAIADRLKSIPDPADRARLAMEAFGREGEYVLGMMSEGSAGIQNLAAGFAKFSSEDIRGIRDAREQLDNLNNTLTVWTGKILAGIDYAGQFYGILTSGKYSLTDVLLGHAHVVNDIAEMDKDDSDSKAKQDAATAKAMKLAAARKEADEHLKIWKDYRRRQREFEPGTIDQLEADKIGEQRAMAESKSYKERMEHAGNILEIEHKISDLKRKAAEEQQQADEIRQHAAERIAELSKEEQERYMPTLKELHASRYGGQAAQIEMLERRAKRDYLRGDPAEARKDIAARDKIYDSLADKGIVAKRHEAREILDIQTQMRDALKHLASGDAAVKIKVGK